MVLRRFFSWLFTGLSLLGVTIVLLLFLIPPAGPDLPTEQEVRARITNLRTITGTEYRYRDVIYFGEQSRFLGLPAGSRQILFSVSITVLAGVDLNRGIEVEIDNRRPDRIFVTLPSPEVIRVDAEERSISQYFVQERFGRIDWLSVSDEVEVAKDNNRRDAIDRGLLVDAERQARAVVTRLLEAGGFETVLVRFQPRERGLTG